MKIQKQYTYMGADGSTLTTAIEIPGAKFVIVRYLLIPSPNHILVKYADVSKQRVERTNAYSVVVPENEVEYWGEQPSSIYAKQSGRI